MEEQIQIQSAKSELSNLGIKDLFYKYIRFLPLFIISVALSLLVAYVYLRYATLVYESSGSMIIQDDSKAPSGGDKLDNILASDNKKNIQNEIEYIRSKKLMTRVVKALDLNFSYTAVGKIKELNIYKSSPFTIEAFKIKDSSGFVLQVDFLNAHNFRINGDGPFTYGQVFENTYGVFKINRSSFGAPSGQYKVGWQPTSSVANGLSSGMVIIPKQGTAILNLSFQSTNPQHAADVINSVMAEYQKATIEDKNAKTQQQLIFIDGRLDTVAAQVDSINRGYVQFIKENSAFDLQTQSSGYLTQIEESTKERNTQQELLNKAYQIESGLLSKTQTIKTPSSLGIADPTLNKMVDAYNEAQ